MTVAPLPPQLVAVVDTLVAKGVISAHKRLDACTINLYAAGQWIPPHIDNPTFDRPFVTVSLCSQQPMVLGRGMVWPEGAHPGAAPGQGVSVASQRTGEEVTLELPVGSALGSRFCTKNGISGGTSQASLP